MRAARLEQMGDLRGSEREIERALEANPQLIRGYGQLLGLHVLRGDLDAIEPTVQRALQEAPRRRYHLRISESAAYERAGELEKALAALRRAHSGGPFASKIHVANRIALLERKMGPDRAP